MQPVALADAPVQTVSIDDVTEAISGAVSGRIPSGTDAALVETQSHRLADILLGIRRWLGIARPRAVVDAPAWMLKVTSAIADLLGWLGWRSPLRSTALRVLQNGVVAEPQEGERLLGRPLLSFEETLRANPSTPQDRLAARIALLMPIAIAMLAVFWLLSGLIAFLRYDDALTVAARAGLPGWTVSAGIAADILLGLAILVRPLAKSAALGMIVVTMLYLIAGSIVAPAFWLDPLGVYLKTLPGAVLALLVLPLLGTR